MKVEKKNKTESFYILIGYLSELIIKNLAIWNLIFLQNKSDEFRLIFFHEKSFVARGGNHIF
jgi:hypothetical protein